MNNSKTRTRKISLQNDYAFCIISPVSPSSLPGQNQRPTISISTPLDNPGMISSFSTPRISIGEEALEHFGSDTNDPSRSGFRRWSLCNYQQAQSPVFPVVTELTSDFADAESETSSSQISRSSSSSSMNWLSGILTNIPERIRKLSTEKNKFDVHNLQEDEEVRDQLKKMYVY